MNKKLVLLIGLLLILCSFSTDSVNLVETRHYNHSNIVTQTLVPSIQAKN